MAKQKPTDETVKPADQEASGKGSAKALRLPCKVLTNGMLHGGCHHAAGKVLELPEPEAELLKKRGDVEILPGLA